jgi:hypothetical protein
MSAVGAFYGGYKAVNGFSSSQRGKNIEILRVTPTENAYKSNDDGVMAEKLDISFKNINDFTKVSRRDTKLIPSESGNIYTNISVSLICILLFLVSCYELQSNWFLTRAILGSRYLAPGSPSQIWGYAVRRSKATKNKLAKDKIYYRDPETGYESNMTDEESKAYLIELGILTPDGSLSEYLTAEKVVPANKASLD